MTELLAPDQALNLLIDRAKALGSTASDASVSQGEGVSVDVREGKLESVERDESTGVALRCLVGYRQAHVSGSRLARDDLETLVERCVAMAKAAPEDPHCGIAPAEDLATDWPDLDLEGDGPLETGLLETDALAAEAAALAVPGVKQVAQSGTGWSRGTSWLAASNGFHAMKSGGSSGIGIAAVAERDGAMERDYESWSTRHRANRPTPDEIGRIAGERTVARLGARKVQSCKAPVLFDRRLSASLLGALVSAISGPAVARGVSFLKDRRGEKVFAPGVHVWDDPFRELGLGSRPFDGEGRPVARKALIEDGVLTQWLLNGPSAHQLGLTPNGFASRAFGDPPGVTTSNLHLEAGSETPDALMKSAGTGLCVTEMFGPSINPNTGDYSVGVAGVWFENGEPQFPVSEVTIASDLPTMFAHLIPASDLEFRGATNAPSVLVEEMTIAGV